jgi:hypothetical protein
VESGEELKAEKTRPRRLEDFLSMGEVEEEEVILWWRARARECFAARSSSVTEREVALRVRSDSSTGRWRAPKVCQMEETAAKPEREAMREIPMMPTRSRHFSEKWLSVSLRHFSFSSSDFRRIEARGRCQKAKSHETRIANSSINLDLAFHFVLLFDVVVDAVASDDPSPKTTLTLP